MKIKALIAAVVLSAMTVDANVYELPVTTIEGKDYYYYEVKPKETLYSLSHKLEMSQDEMIKYNPSLAEGLKAGATLYFPVEALGRAEASTTHKVAKGETIYGISKQYHISIEQLLQLNPSAQDGLKVGDELLIKHVPKAEPVSAKTQSGLHTIAKGETLYSIAVEYKTTVDDLLALNPGLTVDKYDAGKVIRVNELAPLTVAGNVTPNGQTLVFTPRPEYVDSQNDLNAGDVLAANEINIAILMPFMLNAEEVDKKARTNLDFYKGFILAADSLNNSGAKIKVYAYDTYNSADSVKLILSRSEMARMNAIVTPPGAKDVVAQVAQMADMINAYTFNVFYANDTTHYNHSRVMQGNIVRDNMYDKVAETLVAQYGDYIPVIIGSPDDRSRADVVEVIKAKYAEAGIEALEITFKKKLTAEDLKTLDKTKKYVFIPISKSEKELDKYSAALKAYAKEVTDGAMALFGYPEWTVYKGERLKTLHALNTVIYSRFYYNEQDDSNKAFEQKFASTYKHEMIKSTPIQAALGFDSGYYLIEALRRGNGNPVAGGLKYDGLQYGFEFESVGDGKGVENKVLYFVYFTPDGVIKRVRH